MSSGINKVILIGNVTRDPDVRHTSSGSAMTSLSLATNERWKDKATGETKEMVEFHKVSMYGKVAEIAGQYLRKGSQVYIEGRLQTRKWEKDGIERYTTEVVVDMGGTMLMLGGRGGDDAPRQQHTQGRQDPPARTPPRQPQPPQPAPDYDSLDDDIPF